ncbi:hypothetical protein Tco_1430723 [Tanacetum coccineum]
MELGFRDLKQTKLTYASAYTKLIKKVKKLENKVKSNQAKRRAIIVVFDDEEALEDPSKQGRNISKIDQDPTISLVQHDVGIQGRQEHDMEFKFDLDAAKDVSTVEEDISTAKLVSTASVIVITASVDVSTATVSTAKDKVRLKEQFLSQQLEVQKEMHKKNLLKKRLYDSCGVHHVSTEKGIDIYMLIEKEYPLARGTLTQMLVAKLLVEQDNEMSRELLRKIFMQVERPRR